MNPIEEALYCTPEEAVQIQLHPDVFVQGIRESGGPVNSVVERNPDSPRSLAYMVGRNIGLYWGPRPVAG